ncbi:MAG: hypothetical protein FD155_3210 [Bacteroidetes bacterium]|nr:MAG: hypothetical protein FD155_3210 [Bacteroidota bacterium]
MPLFHPDLINAINQFSDNSADKVSINLGMNFAPETFHQGYGVLEQHQSIIYNLHLHS